MSREVLPWLEYEWWFGAPVGLYRALCERLRGTPARLEELLRDPPTTVADRPESDRWSIQEHAGHLSKVEQLWITRIEEYLKGETTLTAADMSNASTESADFNRRPLSAVLASFRAVRGDTMRVLDEQSLEVAARSAHHPRLGREMRLVDLCPFMAEHDDHHLAMIRAQLGR